MNNFETLLHDKIKKELTKRGFHAPFTLKIEKNRIKIESEPFQTVPVIFEELRIIAFSSNVKKNESNHDIKEFWVDIYVSFTLFDSGTNGASLFSVFGKYSSKNNIINFNIR